MEIYLKAAEWIVRYSEFYHKDAADWTLQVLDDGLLRASQAAQGDFPWQWQSVDSKTSDRWGRMAFDRSGQLWVTSRWSEGIAVRSTSGRWSRLTNGLPNLDNQAITRDAQGNMWVGFNAGVGISKWNGSTWQNMPVPSTSPYRVELSADERAALMALIRPTGQARMLLPARIVLAAADGEGRSGVALNFVVDEPLETVERRLRAAGFPPEGTIVDQEWGRSLLVPAPDGTVVQVDEQDRELYT